MDHFQSQRYKINLLPNNIHFAGTHLADKIVLLHILLYLSFQNAPNKPVSFALATKFQNQDTQLDSVKQGEAHIDTTVPAPPSECQSMPPILIDTQHRQMCNEHF